MSTNEFFALLPLITLSSVILLLTLVIAFWRNLALACGLSVTGLMLTLASIVWVFNATPVEVTPLIVVDKYALVFSGLIILASLAVTLLSYDYFKNQGPRHEEFFLLLLLSTLGAMVLVASNHIASFVLGLELLSVSIYVLVSYPIRGLQPLEAALKYLILSGVSSALLLFGIALIYAALGSLSFQQLALTFYSENQSISLFVVTGSALMLAGIGFKLSLAPFHMWTPDVYQGAPAPVAAYIATISKGAVFAFLFRYFATADVFKYDSFVAGVSIIAILSMLAGNILALLQTSIKRILAYSSIAHLGYLMVAFIAGGMAGGKALAIESASYFLFAYFITTIGAFSVVSVMSISNRDAGSDEDRDQIEQYEGLFWRKPFLATVFTAMLLSLAGIPLTAGFMGKFYLFAAGIQSELWLLITMLIIGSGIGLFYYLRIIFAMTKRTENVAANISIQPAGGSVMIALTFLLIWLGIYPSPIIDLIQTMISSLS